MHELVAAYDSVTPAAQVAVHIKDSVNYYGWSTITFIQTLVPAFNKVVVSGDLIDMVLPARNCTNIMQALSYNTRRNAPEEFLVATSESIKTFIFDTIKEADDEDLLEWAHYAYNSKYTTIGSIQRLKESWLGYLVDNWSDCELLHDLDSSDELSADAWGERLHTFIATDVVYNLAAPEEGDGLFEWLACELAQDTEIGGGALVPSRDYTTAIEIMEAAWSILAGNKKT